MPGSFSSRAVFLRKSKNPAGPSILSSSLQEAIWGGPVQNLDLVQALEQVCGFGIGWGFGGALH